MHQQNFLNFKLISRNATHSQSLNLQAKLAGETLNG